jgi:hypothetical protein
MAASFGPSAFTAGGARPMRPLNGRIDATRWR